MASTFSGQTLTSTGKIGKDTIDASDQYYGFGSLITSGGQAINSTEPLGSSYIGSDIKLVHGDQWENIDKKQTIYVGSDCDETINGNWSFQVNGSSSVVRVGPSSATFLDSESNYNVGEVYDTEYTSGFQWTPYEFEAIGFFFEACPCYIEVVGLDLTIAIFDIILTGVDLTLAIAMLEEAVVKEKAEVTKVQFEALKLKVSEMGYDVRKIHGAVENHLTAGPHVADPNVP
jgi:hypothetical protein